MLIKCEQYQYLDLRLLEEEKTTNDRENPSWDEIQCVTEYDKSHNRYLLGCSKVCD